MKSGFCGLSISVQCYTIGALQCASSFCLLILSIIRMIKPGWFIKDWERLKLDERFRTSLLDQNDEIAVEIMIAAFSTLIASTLLIFGVRRKSPSLVYPWIVITIVQLGGGLIFFILRASARNSNGMRMSKILAVIFYYILMAYFLYSVVSYHTLLKKKKRLQRTVLPLELSSGYPSSEMINFSSRPSLVQEYLDDTSSRSETLVSIDDQKKQDTAV